MSTVSDRKFKFSAHDSDLEYLCWRCKNFLASSDWFFAVKGQKISDDFFIILKYLKNNNFFLQIFALAFKKWLNKNGVLLPKLF